MRAAPIATARWPTRASCCVVVRAVSSNCRKFGDRGQRRAFVLSLNEAAPVVCRYTKSRWIRIEQWSACFRSKGVRPSTSLTQSPAGCARIDTWPARKSVQHAARSFLPKDRKAVRVRHRPFAAIRAECRAMRYRKLAGRRSAVCHLSGNEKRRATPVQRVLMRPASEPDGPITDQERGRDIAEFVLAGFNMRRMDRESAYEKFFPKAAPPPPPKKAAGPVLKTAQRDARKQAKARIR